ncbi:ABC transporter permease [Granulicoccus sp. GXG6511]|uniref:ABC transporter permease n=1 Tax=Granulicoccus sp. GXG6511 TaxID=3381351 RepID=UPI003D7C6965
MSTTLDFSPAPGAAPAARRILTHARTEATLLIRNGEQLLLALVIPIGILIGGRFFGSRLGLDLSVTAPSVLGLAVLSSGFTSLAISTGFERRYGVLERLAATPLTRTGLLVGKAVALLWVTGGQLVILAVVALALGWRPVFHPLAALVAIIAIGLGLVAYAAWGLVLAGTLRAEITLALANLVYLTLLAAGAVLVPVANYPGPLRATVELVPTAALGEALRGASTGTPHWWTLFVLLVWAALGLVLARKVFRWMS